MLKIVKNETFPLPTLDKRIWDFVVLWMRLFNLKVTDKSIEETAFQAAISKQATKLAIQLPQVIHNATILEIHLPPKAGRQTKRMKFIEIANLLANIPRVGMAKLTVGYIKNGECIEYAITEYTVIK